MTCTIKKDQVVGTSIWKLREKKQNRKEEKKEEINLLYKESQYLAFEEIKKGNFTITPLIILLVIVAKSEEGKNQLKDKTAHRKTLKHLIPFQIQKKKKVEEGLWRLLLVLLGCAK